MIVYTCDPNLELTGQSALALIQSMRHQYFEPVLEQHGFANIEPNAWYSLQRLLDVLNDMAQRGSTMFDFVSIGLAAAENSELPPEMQELSLEQFINAYYHVYQMRHRNGDAGYIRTERVSEKHLKIVMDIPYPDDVFYGVFYGYARRFVPSDHKFTVKYDDTLPGRDRGGDVTIIHIMWE